MNVQISDNVLMNKLMDQAIRIVQLEITVEALNEQIAKLQAQETPVAKAEAVYTNEKE